MAFFCITGDFLGQGLASREVSQIHFTQPSSLPAPVSFVFSGMFGCFCNGSPCKGDPLLEGTQELLRLGRRRVAAAPHGRHSVHPILGSLGRSVGPRLVLCCQGSVWKEGSDHWEGTDDTMSKCRAVTLPLQKFCANFTGNVTVAPGSTGFCYN